jgi:phosphopantothenoylcysteine decarboxylase/phosphopantothenate--cysteine ligase
MGFLDKRTIVLGVGAGIAAYRACELARLLMKRGAQVRAAMTPNACHFVAPLTFQALTGHPVLTDLFDPAQDATFGHLALGRAADLFIVAPATADLIARIRGGFADDPVTTALLASRCKVLLAPAMNTAMWENRQTQENLRALLADGRFSSVGPGVGTLADGDVGAGRLAEPPDIAEAAEDLLAPKDLSGWRVVVTAGPTREHLDPVRFLSNPSSGRMGYAVARAAAMRGARVLLVSGPTELAAPSGVELVRVTSAEEMAAAVLPKVPSCQLFVAAAAVADQRPKARATQKVKKREGEEALSLVRTPDVLLSASAAAPAEGARPILVGFAAETENLLGNAREKLARKKLDLVAANDVSDAAGGFASASNRLVLIDRRGQVVPLDMMSKEDAAHALLDRVIALRDIPGTRDAPTP